MNEFSEVRYPDVATKVSDSAVILHTNIRKKHRGKWYLWEVHKRYSASPGAPTTQEFLPMLYNQFNRDCYMVIMFGVVNTKLEHDDGLGHTGNVFKLDYDQRDEMERLNNAF
jgi:hypothetical protein